MENQKGRIERSYLPDSFKRQLIEEYLNGNLTKYQIQRKYGIKKNGALSAWMRYLGYSESDKKAINLEVIKDPELAKKQTIKSSQTLEMEMKIRLLERQLEDEKLRTEMLNRMVDLAEKTYKITVRKNSNTK